MQYDLDIKSNLSEIFKKVRKILLSYPEIKEIETKKQFSYKDNYAVVAMLRVREDRLVVAFGKGAKLQSRFNILQGSGKIVRHIYFKSLNEVNEKLLREIIEESLILNLEAYELKKLKIIRS